MQKADKYTQRTFRTHSLNELPFATLLFTANKRKTKNSPTFNSISMNRMAKKNERNQFTFSLV